MRKPLCKSKIYALGEERLFSRSLFHVVPHSYFIYLHFLILSLCRLRNRSWLWTFVQRPTREILRISTSSGTELRPTSNFRTMRRVELFFLNDIALRIIILLPSFNHVILLCLLFSSTQLLTLLPSHSCGGLSGGTGV